MYPNFNCWVHCGQVLSVPTMYSPCAHWVYESLSPVNTGKGAKLHGGRVSNGLHCLVHAIVGTGPVQDPHMEQAEEDWIVYMSPINPSEPFCPSDHVHPQTIIKEEIQVHIPPPPIVNNGLIIGFTLLDHPVIGVLGYL